jgi:hypothetical protein
MTIVYIITGALMGLVFGFALEKGRVFEPGMIVGQFQLRNWIMAKMFLTAIATTMLVVAVLTGIGVAEMHPKADLYPAVIAGGLIFGAGMALTGACPGTVLAQIGAGYKDAWFTVAGGILGAMAYGYMEPYLSQMNNGPGKITLADTFGIPFWILALISVALIAVFLFLLEKWRPWREDLGDDYDGVPSGSTRIRT